MVNVVGLDIGRRNVKLFSGKHYIWFPAVIGEYRDIKLDYILDERGFSGEFQGEKFFAGTLAQDESEFQRQMLVENKATPDALLLALIALHKTGFSQFDIVTGVPVSQHDDFHKNALINLLKNTWTIEVDNDKRSFVVNRVRVSVEGGGAFWSAPRNGLVRIVDGGSKTINYITIKDKRYVDRDSGTLNFGFDTNKSTNHAHMVTSIAGELGKKWGQQDTVLTVGGNAEILAKYLKPYFPNTTLLQENKEFKPGDKTPFDMNMFANAVGYYNIGSNVI